MSQSFRTTRNALVLAAARRFFRSSSAFAETDWLSGEAVCHSNACRALTPGAGGTTAAETATARRHRLAGIIRSSMDPHYRAAARREPELRPWLWRSLADCHPEPGWRACPASGGHLLEPDAGACIQTFDRAALDRHVDVGDDHHGR